MDESKSKKPVIFKRNFIVKIRQFCLLFCISIISGCNPFAPTLDSDLSGSSLILTEQLSPQDVMTNFAFAYNFKDSLVYSDIIDSTFLFVSKDYTTDPITDLTWHRDTELKTTAGIFKRFQIINLVWGTIFEDYIDRDSTIVELKQDFQLTLDGGGSQFPTINGSAIFILKENSFGIWKIIRWEDLSKF